MQRHLRLAARLPERTAAVKRVLRPVLRLGPPSLRFRRRLALARQVGAARRPRSRLMLDCGAFTFFLRDWAVFLLARTERMRDFGAMIKCHQDSRDGSQRAEPAGAGLLQPKPAGAR